MDFNYYLQKCGDDDILLFGDSLIKWEKFKRLIKRALDPSDIRNSKVSSAINEDFNSNVYPEVKIYPGSLIDSNKSLNCEILRVGSPGWEKGKMKLKITLEFIPDESEIAESVGRNQIESPLDDLREMLKIDNQ